MEPDLPESGLREERLKNARVEVVHLSRRARLRREHELAGDVRFALGEGLNEPLAPEFQEHSPQLPAHINAAWLLALGREHFPRPAPVIVALHQDVTVRIVLASAKLQIAPLKTRELALPQTRAHSRENEGMILEAQLLLAALEQPLNFSGLQ